MKDRLADIIGNGAEAFARLSFADQDWLLQSAGSMAAARAQACGQGLPRLLGAGLAQG